jgi:hypothetical protein
MAVESLRNDVLDKVLRGVDFTSPSPLYLSLHDGDPGTNGSNELSASPYARQETAFDAASGGQCVNSNQETFDIGESTTVSHVGLWDASTGGNFLWRGTLDLNKNVEDGDQILFDAGDVTVPTSGS